MTVNDPTHSRRYQFTVRAASSLTARRVAAVLACTCEATTEAYCATSCTGAREIGKRSKDAEPVKSITVHVSDHAIRGSSLQVLRAALLREIKLQARRHKRARQAGTKRIAHREQAAAETLAREVGCTRAEIASAAGLS